MADYVAPNLAEPVKRTPAAGPRPDKGKMDDKELQTLIGGLVDSAIQYTDNQLSPERALATKYYKGEPFGNEEEGRSQVVSTDVRDGIVAITPPILRAIFGPEQVVEFRPRTRDAIPMAEQATDYVQYTFAEENGGFLRTLDVLKDGLQKKIGIFKWGWDESYTKCSYELENLTDEQVQLLAAKPGIDITRVTPSDVQPGTFDIELTREEREGCARVWSVPPEEFIFNREAKDIETALFVAHRTEKTRGELIAMGVDEKLIGEQAGPGDTDLQANAEKIERLDNLSTLGVEQEAGKANDRIRYIEAYARIDFDGDGVAELRRICAIGTGNTVVENKPWDHAPFAIWCPDPEPHTVLGQSWFDRLRDMQLVKSSILRATLDSLAASIFPRTWYKQGDANLADVLNTAIGAPIRTQTGAGAVGTFQQDFVGREAFPVLGYCDEVIERRTGQNKGAAGMDIDALQSTEKAAAKASVTASQQQQELLVRIFAEMTLKPLFRGLLRLLVSHQPRQTLAKLRGQWVEVDPSSWDANMDVTVNVALGSGFIEEKIATLAAMAEEMKFIFATFGLQNPICDLKQYRDTLAEIAVLRGKKNPEVYFKPVDMNQVNAQLQQAQQNQAPSPEMMLAQAQIQLEQQKADAKLQLERETAQANIMLEDARAARQHQLEMDKAQREHDQRMADIQQKLYATQLEDDRLRDKQAAEIELKRLEIEARYQVQLNQAQVDAAIEHTRISTQSDDTRHATEHKAATDTHATLVQADVDRETAASGEAE